MGASAVPIPPVASAPALQWVSTFAPSGISGSPASPIRRHMARSSSQIAVASAWSRSHIAAPPQLPGVSVATRVMRSSAQRRFTAVARVAPSSRTASPSRARKRPRGAARSSRVPATRPIAAAIPMSGAPRRCSVRIASATASPLSRSHSIFASGSARWSTIRTAPDGLQAMAWTLMGIKPTFPRMTYQTLLFAVRDGVAFITINRPDKLNALNDQVVDELADAAERVATDDAIKGAILSGAGQKAFVAGAGIAGPAETSPFDGKAPALRGQARLRRFENRGKPPIAARDGY